MIADNATMPTMEKYAEWFPALVYRIVAQGAVYAENVSRTDNANQKHIER